MQLQDHGLVELQYWLRKGIHKGNFGSPNTVMQEKTFTKERTHLQGKGNLQLGDENQCVQCDVTDVCIIWCTFLLTNTVVTHTTMGCSGWSKYFASKTKFKFDSLSIYCYFLHSRRRSVSLWILIRCFWKRKGKPKSVDGKLRKHTVCCVQKVYNTFYCDLYQTKWNIWVVACHNFCYQSAKVWFFPMRFSWE